MQETHPDPVEALLGRLLRQPDALRDPQVDRALARLLAARSDAAYVLMHRVLVLEAALTQLQASPNQAQAVPVSAPPARSFLRDAAVVTTGVLAGTWLATGVASAGEDAWAAADGPADVGGEFLPDLDF